MPAQREDWTWDEELMLLDWYDGPVEGWATRAGGVVYYHADGLRERDGQRVYALTQVPDAARPHVRVITRGWDRWLAAFQAGETTRDTHPTLPEDRAAHAASEAALDALLAGREETAWAAWVAATGAQTAGLLRWAPITREEYEAALDGADEDEAG